MFCFLTGIYQNVDSAIDMPVTSARDIDPLPFVSKKPIANQKYRKFKFHTFLCMLKFEILYF